LEVIRIKDKYKQLEMLTWTVEVLEIEMTSEMKRLIFRMENYFVGKQ